MGKNARVREMGWRDPAGAAGKPIKAVFSEDAGILSINGKEYAVSNWSDEDFEDFCGEFGAQNIVPDSSGRWTAVLETDPTAELHKLYKVTETKMRNSNSKSVRRVVRENDELIDDAAATNQGAEVPPAPQQVPVPAAAQQPAPAANAAPVAPDMSAQPGPMNPLVPPQPGMIPTGWMFPNQSAQAVAMDTGDVNLAAAAPGGGVVDNQPVTNEEADMIQEYRRFKRAKRLESLALKISKRVKENSEEELEPEMPKDTQLAIPPEAEADGVNVGVEGEGEGAANTNGTVDMDELEDIVIDLNTLFADAGGDLAAVTSPEALADDYDGADEDTEVPDEDTEVETEEPAEPVKESRKKKENKLVDALPEDEADLGPVFGGDIEGLDVEGAVPEDDDFFEDEIPGELDPGNAIQDYGFDEARRTKKRTWREAVLAPNAVDIKFPAGTPAPKVSSEAVNAAYAEPAGSAIQAFENRAKARRAVLAELRRRNRKAEGLADADLSDASKTQEEVIDEIIPGSNKSAILTEARTKGPSAKFLERYKEKQKLNYRELLNKGLLG